MVRPAPIDPPQIEELLWEGFSPCGLGLDVGANVGQSVPHLLEFCERVAAFEPAAESFTHLRAAFAEDPRVSCLLLALSDVDGSVGLVAAPRKMETGQLVTVDLASDWQGQGDWDMAGAVERQVPCLRLDTWAYLNVAWPGFVKIDVEGHELRVLHGAPKLLARGVELLIEVHAEALGRQIHELLDGRYRIEEVRHPHYAEGSELWRTHFWMKCWPA